MVYVHWLHQPQQSMPQRRVSFAHYQHIGRQRVQVPIVELLGCLFRIQLDQDAHPKWRENRLHKLRTPIFVTKSCRLVWRMLVLHTRLIDQIFKWKIGQNVEVYVDDIVVKSHSVSQHVADLKEVFREICKYDMHPNPEKCTLGVSGGKFLGSMIIHWGIEVNPDKCTTILEMHNPINV